MKGFLSQEGGSRTANCEAWKLLEGCLGLDEARERRRKDIDDVDMTPETTGGRRVDRSGDEQNK
jgi:hypothetical protein